MFKPIIQAAALLQAPEKEEEDASAIFNSCNNLSDGQIIWMFQQFGPKDDFEDRVHPDFIQKVEDKLKKRIVALDKNTLLVSIKGLISPGPDLHSLQR